MIGSNEILKITDPLRTLPYLLQCLRFDSLICECGSLITAGQNDMFSFASGLKENQR